MLVASGVYLAVVSACWRFRSLAILTLSLLFFFFSSRRRHTRSVSAFLLNRSSDLTFPILASLLVRLVVLLPFQLLRLSLATPSRWTPLALSVFLHCVVALLLTLL